MRSKRFALVAIALAIALVSCNHSDGGVGPSIETLSATITSPTGPIAQSGWPTTSVKLEVTASSSRLGPIMNPSFITWRENGSTLGNGVSLTLEFANGAHTVCVTVANPTNSSIEPKEVCRSFSITPAPDIAISIAPMIVGPQAVCQNFRVWAKKGNDVFKTGNVDSTDVGTDCKSHLSARLYLLPDSGRVTLWVDAKDPSNRTHYPFLASVRPDSLRVEQRPVLGSLSYTVTSGDFAGYRSSFDLAKCLTWSGDGVRSFCYWQMTPDGHKLYGVGSWPRSKLPLPVGINRIISTYSFTEADSTIIWTTLARVNQKYGTEYFRPVNYGSFDPKDGVQIVSIGGGNEASTGFSNGDITNGMMNLSPDELHNPDRAEFVISHEAGHDLGVGHTCAWKSVMWTGCDGSKISLTITADDVAYLRYIDDFENLRRQTGSQYGMANVDQGRRVVMLNLPLEDVRW